MTDYSKQAMKIYDDNVLNIDTERFYREAEDDFFYFYQTDNAIEKLKNGLSFSPNHIKSLKLLGDIFYTEGKMELAFEYYSIAAALKPCDSAILSSLASVCDVLGDLKNALSFINLAYKYLTIEDFRLYAPIYDLKISLLIKLQRYDEAKALLDYAKKQIPLEDSDKMAVTTHSILKKKLKVKEKIKNLNIKLVSI